MVDPLILKTSNPHHVKANKKFDKLTAEEIQALTGEELEKYNAYILAKEEDAEKSAPAPAAAPAAKVAPVEKPKTVEELKAIGDDYFERHPDSLLEKVYITSDGQIFPGTVVGKNHCENYKITAGGQVTSIEYKR